MTGYGRVKQENEWREITVEIRSVNHRFLELNVKVPRVYGYLEDLVNKKAQKAIARGKVDIYVTVRAKEGSDIRITPNMPVIRGYLDALKQGDKPEVAYVCGRTDGVRFEYLVPAAEEAEGSEAE